MLKFSMLVIILLFFVKICSSRTTLVAKNNGDYSTIMAALIGSAPGDTILVKAGVYKEFVQWPKSGSAERGYITLKAYGDGAAVIDGTGLTITQTNATLLLISNKNYVAVIGMEICNNICASTSIFNKGLQIEGESQHIIIKNCKIHHIENNSTSTSAGANAIGVFGTVAATPVTDILIDSCEIYNNKTAYSEAVSIDGNVDGFKISHCYVHDNNNIGILLSGYYGECKNCGVSDQARHGVISDNIIKRCSSCDNPSYSGDCSADGIYSDGGGKSIIERNIISECDIGIEAGAELSSAVDDSMIIRDNLIYNCNTGGMFIGGYDKNLGWTINCTVQNNTFYMNDVNSSGSGEFLIQKSHDNIIRNNIFFTSNQKLAISNALSNTYCYNNTITNNIFYSSSGGTGIDGSELDSHAKITDPLFVSNGADFHLKVTSPAINACDATFVPASSEVDLDGNARKSGSAVDIGAYESLLSSINRSARLTTGLHQQTEALFINVKSTRYPHVYIGLEHGSPILLNGRTGNLTPLPAGGKPIANFKKSIM